MLKRLLIAALCLMIAFAPLSAHAADDYQSIIDSIYAYVRGGQDAQEWVNSVVAPNAGSSADNYIINLNHTAHDLDLNAYIEAAAERVQPGGINNPVSRMRCALALISCGAWDRVPEQLADDSIGKLGVMSYIYGLHLLSNGAKSAMWTRESITEKLLDLQKADGGWAVMGNFGDVDVTAMCLQALALCADFDGVAEAMERGIAFLSQRQKDNGAFSSNGRENSESCCQVVMTLASLGIDPDTDARFIKNGISAFDALMAYQLPSGGFMHLPGESENETACIQAIQALFAQQMAGIPYFDFSSEKLALVQEKNAALPLWKIIALCAIALLAVAGSIFALTRRHGRMKQLIFIVLAACVAASLVLMIHIESASGYYSADEKAQSSGEVWLTIRCDTVAGLLQDGSTPEDGVILARTSMPCDAEDSVFDILTDAARKYEIHMEHEGGSGDLAYINGINYLYEYAQGDLSGWIYTVNGVQPSVGCGAYIVKPGDEIVWEYTLNLGEDLK